MIDDLEFTYLPTYLPFIHGAQTMNEVISPFGMSRDVFNKIWTGAVGFAFYFTCAAWAKTQMPNSSFEYWIIKFNDQFTAALWGILVCSVFLALFCHFGAIYARHLANANDPWDARLPIVGNISVIGGTPASRIYHYFSTILLFIFLFAGQIHFLNKFMDGKAFDAQSHNFVSMYSWISPLSIVREAFTGAREILRYGDTYSTAVSYYGLIQIVILIVLQYVTLLTAMNWLATVRNSPKYRVFMFHGLATMGYMLLVIYYYLGRENA